MKRNYKVKKKSENQYSSASSDSSCSSQLAENPFCKSQKAVLSSGNVKFPEHQQLTAQKYSLVPDMLLGWKPQLDFKGPITLSYQDEYLDKLISKIDQNYQQNQFTNFKVVYLGFRAKDSFVMHDSFTKLCPHGYKFRYIEIIKSRYKSVLQYLDNNLLGDIEDKLNGRNYLGMNPLFKNQLDYQFDSYFESGNLDFVIQTDTDEFDLYLRPDTNTKGHTQWYNFRVRNKKRHQKIKINIMNFTKVPSLYNYDKKPFVYSDRLKKEQNIDWHQDG